jgi:cell division protein FtsW
VAKQKKVHAEFDYTLLIPVLCLLVLGLIAVYSASSHLASHRLGDSYFYLKRQALFCIFGLGLMWLAKKIPCSFYSKLVYPLLLVSFGLLAVVFVQGVGTTVGGASRWIRISVLTFQPAELAKFALAVYMAYSMSKKGANMRSFSKGLLPHLLIAGAFMVLIVLQPDLGTAVIIGCWALLLLFVGGVRIIQIGSVLLLSVPVVFFLIWNAEYRLKRLWAFLNPWEDPQGIGFQIIHSFLAFGSGGPLGVGLGDSKQKLFYLPEPHTDFILSIVAEELGLLGIATTIVLFTIIIMRGIKIALNARDLYSSYLAFGLTCLIGLQVLVNMGVVMGLLPTKGLTLPLISYGGSSLIVTLISIGVLLNISSKA